MADPAFLHRVQAGIRLIEQGELGRAEQVFSELTRAHPRDAGLWQLLGAALHKAERYEEALAACQRALELDRRNPDYLYSVGSVLLNLHRPEEAAKKFRATLSARPNHVDALLDLGRALRDMGDLGEAEKTFRRVIQRAPANSEAHADLCNLFESQNRYEEAERCARDGIVQLPGSQDLHFFLGLLLLKQGRFAEGWTEYQWRLSRSDELRGAQLPFGVWRETPWTGRLDGQAVELWPEQGLGDILFFLRFADGVRRLGARTVLHVPRRLAAIVGRAGCVDEVRELSDATALTRESVLLGDLPFMLGIGEETPEPLRLVPLEERTAAMRRRLERCGPPPYAGLTWRAGLKTGPQRYQYLKDVPLEGFAQAVRSLPGTLVAVQRNPERGEVEQLSSLAGRPVSDFSDTNADLEDALALMDCLDEYVGVSNTNMHLRAGVRRRAHVLVPLPPEWRWMAQGERSPWFGQFAVFRQTQSGDWSEPLPALHSSLKTMG